MTKQGPISLEALKLRLISGTGKAAQDPLLTKDGIGYLLKALVYADSAFSAEIENVLVKAGDLAIPQLVKALTAEHMNVRSIAAMSLIRLGKKAEPALLQAYPKLARKPAHRWVFDFVFDQLGLQAPELARRDGNSNLVSMATECAG